MSITDELRRYISGPAKSGISHICEKAIANIADRIDAEHESACAEAYGNGVESVALPDMTAYVKLPKDADGETINIGELVDEMLPFGGYAAPAPVDTMELSRGASGYGWMVKLDAENRAFISPKLLRHHHVPTVEDVTCEFLQDLSDWLGLELDIDYIKADDLFAEYAAKLRLAGEDA